MVVYGVDGNFNNIYMDKLTPQLDSKGNPTGKFVLLNPPVFTAEEVREEIKKRNQNIDALRRQKDLRNQDIDTAKADRDRLNDEITEEVALKDHFNLLLEGVNDEIT